MNRRDTIVVAVLINAGVLVVLFTSALKSRSQEEQFATLNPTTTSPIVQEIAIHPEKDKFSSGRDEVDQVIKQFTTLNEEKTELSKQGIENQVAENALTSQVPDFAADLNAFANAEATHSHFSSSNEAPSSQEISKGYTEVKVKKGDFLAKIAKRHHTTVDAIMKLNKLNSTNLKIGQTLKIPISSSSSSIAAAPKEAAPVIEGAKYYTVRNGDNPWTIAVKNKIKVEDLLRLNNLDAEKAKRLKPGDQLRIR